MQAAILAAVIAVRLHAAAPSPLETQGAFFALSVADLDASVAWYRDRLGLELTMAPGPGPTAVAVLEGHGLTVELVRDPAARPLGELAPSAANPPAVHGFFKVGFVVADLDLALAWLAARGVKPAYGPYPRRDGQRSNAIVRDHAGNLIQLFGR